MTRYYECLKCNTHCLLRGFNDSEPCWGEVQEAEVVWENSEFVSTLHYCEGHRDDVLNGRKYVPKPENE